MLVYFKLVCHFLSLLKAMGQFFHNFIVKKVLSGLSICTLLRTNLVPHLPTQKNAIWLYCVTKRLFLPYLGPFVVLVGPYLGHSWSCKWPKLVCLDVLIGVPTIFHPF